MFSSLSHGKTVPGDESVDNSGNSLKGYGLGVAKFIQIDSGSNSLAELIDADGNLEAYAPKDYVTVEVYGQSDERPFQGPGEGVVIPNKRPSTQQESER